jgi:hypothetical protein
MHGHMNAKKKNEFNFFLICFNFENFIMFFFHHLTAGFVRVEKRTWWSMFFDEREYKFNDIVIFYSRQEHCIINRGVLAKLNCYLFMKSNCLFHLLTNRDMKSLRYSACFPLLDLFQIYLNMKTSYNVFWFLHPFVFLLSDTDF